MGQVLHGDCSGPSDNPSTEREREGRRQTPRYQHGRDPTRAQARDDARRAQGAHLPLLELWRRLKAHEFRGSLRGVAEWVTRLQRAEKVADRQVQRVPSARAIARLMATARDHPSKADAVTIVAIEEGVPTHGEARALSGRRSRAHGPTARQIACPFTTRLPVYATTAGQARVYRDGDNGRQGRDFGKAVSVVPMAIDADGAPLHLSAGEPAYKRVRGRASALLTSVTDRKSVSTAISFD